MDLSQYTQYMVPLVIGFCICIGYVIKTSLDFIPNKYIPLIMLVTGIALNILINEKVTAEIVIAGALSGLASTGTHQTCKCLNNKKNDESKTEDNNDENKKKLDEKS
ncbi:phage holin family protein [Intestinibacter sp.]